MGVKKRRRTLLKVLDDTLKRFVIRKKQGEMGIRSTAKRQHQNDQKQEGKDFEKSKQVLNMSSNSNPEAVQIGKHQDHAHSHNLLQVDGETSPKEFGLNKDSR